MHDDTVLPVHNKFPIPSRSYTRIQFVQEKTRNSLFYLKWLELISCLLCLSFTFITIYYTEITKLNKSVLITSNFVSVSLILAEIIFPYFKKTVPLLLQIIDVAFNSIMYLLLTILIYHTNINHDLISTLKILHGAASVLFLVDFLCKIIISKHLYQTTQAKSVADVGISTNLPSPSNNRPRKPARSALTTTPITYGGTFPVQKNQPPFMQNRHKPIQQNIFDFGPSSIERLMNKTKTMQNDVILPPFYLDEERKRKNQIKRRQDSRSTPITYSGTFACNKELVPIAPSSLTTSPRSKKRSSPTILDQISEEKLSISNSLTNTFYNLPGCIMDETI